METVELIWYGATSRQSEYKGCRGEVGECLGACPAGSERGDTRVSYFLFFCEKGGGLWVCILVLYNWSCFFL